MAYWLAAGMHACAQTAVKMFEGSSECKNDSAYLDLLQLGIEPVCMRLVSVDNRFVCRRLHVLLAFQAGRVCARALNRVCLSIANFRTIYRSLCFNRHHDIKQRTPSYKHVRLGGLRRKSVRGVRGGTYTSKAIFEGSNLCVGKCF